MKKTALVFALAFVFIFSAFALGETESILTLFPNQNQFEEEILIDTDTSEIIENVSEKEDRFTESALKDYYFTDYETNSYSFDDTYSSSMISSSDYSFDLSSDVYADSIVSGFSSSDSGTTTKDNVVTSHVAVSSSKTQSFVPSIEAKTAPDTDEITMSISIPEETKVHDTEEYEFLTTQGYLKATGKGQDSEVSFIAGGDSGEIEDEPIIYIVEEYGYDAEIVGAVLKKYVTVASYAQRNDLKEEFQDEFELAFKELRETKELTDLIPGLEKSLQEDTTIDDYAITQIFFVGPRTDIVEYIDEYDILHLRMVFPYRLKENQKEAPVICYKVADVDEWTVTVVEEDGYLDVGDWGTIDPKDVVLNWPKEGNIAADFHHFGTLIFLEKKAK